MGPSGPSFVPPPEQDQAGDESEKQWIVDQFYGGVSDSEKQIVRTTYLLEKQYQFYFGQNLNILNDAGWATINRSTVLDSPPGMITALPKWIVSGAPWTNNLYIYDAAGNIYQRSSSGTYTKLFKAVNAQGNGLGVWNNYLYYTTNNTIGIYGPLNNNPVRNDNYLTSNVQDTTATGLAPINTSLPFVTVGHGNYVGKFDGTTWTYNALTLPVASYVRSMDTTNQMLAIATSVSGNSPNVGFIFFWDGATYTYNNWVQADAGIDVVLGDKNRLLSLVGTNNSLYTDSSPFQNFQSFPKLRFEDIISVLPGSATNYKRVALFGVAASTTSNDLVQGVYHWGNRNDNYPEGLNMDYTISTGNTSKIAIGAVQAFGSNLFIGWQDNNTGGYGIDIVNQSNPYFKSASLEGVIFDDMRPADDKRLLTIKCSHLPLNSGETIQLGFKVNRGPYILSSVNSTVGSTTTKLPIPLDYAQFNEAQAKVILGSPGSTAPTVTTLGAAYMPQLTQSQY